MTCFEFVHFLRREKKLLDIDHYFADFAMRLSGVKAAPELYLLAALLSGESSVSGGLCLPKDKIDTPEKLRSYLKLPADAELPVTGEWLPTELPEQLILFDNGNYFMPGNHRIGQEIRKFVKDRLENKLPAADFKQETVTRLNLTDGQKNAASKAAGNRFLIISGGPGTGKTTLLATILACRTETNIRLCAPTGKAQARMQEALQSELENLVDDERKAILRRIPCSTIHRLLGSNPGSNQFSYNARNKLECDLLVVDECSMMSQHLTAQLFEALDQNCSVILLGDHAQLSSVQPGQVFSDLCNLLREHPDHLAVLTESKRFDSSKGIGKLRDCLLPEIVAPGEAAWQYLTTADEEELRYFALPEKEELKEFLKHEIASGNWADFAHFDTLEETWQAFESQRLLSPVTAGPYGTAALNAELLSLLNLENNPAGTPLLQQKNDYELRIFNGDTGMLWYADENREPLPRHAATASTRLLVFFRQEDKSWRGVERELLSDADTAFAMTVHKSQGSGYDRILLFLPDQKENPVLSRELIYTAITRAKKEAVVISNRESFVAAADTKTVRNSGLIDSGL